ncbi:MAG: transcriptional regulator, partial [Deltaproteobacteria bacterium]|nr:transcriptional regulator [Deltaproteobacteria bacterium]
IDYFATHPVFRFEDFVSSHTEGRARSVQASQAVLKQHVRAGNLLHVRRGLYVVVPRGESPDTVQVDPFLLAGHVTADAVVAYHAALQLHGKAHSVSRRFTYLTLTRAKVFEFRGAEFVPVPVPPPLRELPDLGGGLVEKRRSGLGVRVTTLERTLVDVLHAPRHGGGWEEIWRSLETVEFFDLDAVTAYLLKLHSAVAVARVGFFLEQHRDQLMVEEHHLARLQEHAPSHPMYLDRSKREPGRLLARWNLVVPEWVLNRTWAEVT